MLFYMVDESASSKRIADKYLAGIGSLGVAGAGVGAALGYLGNDGGCRSPQILPFPASQAAKVQNLAAGVFQSGVLAAQACGSATPSIRRNQMRNKDAAENGARVMIPRG
jgi:hypothetical protein